MSRVAAIIEVHRSHRYMLLFYSLLAAIGVEPLLELLGFGSRLALLFFDFNLAVAVAAGARRGSALLLAGVVLAIGTRMASDWTGDARLLMLAVGLWASVALIAAARAVLYASQARRVDAEHIYAALSAYLLAGFCFGVVHWALAQAVPGSIAVAGAPAGGDFTLGAAIYFSFVTLATLGYGDIVAAHPATRGLAVLEGVAGQLYLAVLVAGLIGVYLRADSGDPRSPRDG